MQGDQVKNAFPVMVMMKGGVAIPADHFLRIDTAALESHKTILIHTTAGAFMLHDDVAMDMAAAFGLRTADANNAEAAGVARRQEEAGKKGKGKK